MPVRLAPTAWASSSSSHTPRGPSAAAAAAAIRRHSSSVAVARLLSIPLSRPRPLVCEPAPPRPTTTTKLACPPPRFTYRLPLIPPFRPASSQSQSRWVARQTRDQFAREARVQGLKSRAAFKLLQMDERYRVFRRGQTVVDLGYAPGSWAQVAVNRIQPGGRVLGIDLIPAQPPKGVSTIQGDFLSPEVRADVKNFLRDSQRGRLREHKILPTSAEDAEHQQLQAVKDERLGDPSEEESLGVDYIDRERRDTVHDDIEDESLEGLEETKDRTVDVVLSDMSAPWEQTAGFFKRSLSDPYRRLMNTSGNNFRDHAGSMDLCRAALEFAFDVLRPGGHFVCKFYQGAEDKALELQLKRLFAKVHREKPDSSRKESKEAYFVAIKRLPNIARHEVFKGG